MFRSSPPENETLILDFNNLSLTNLPIRIPWRAIFTSIPFIFNVISHFGFFWHRLTIELYVPTYFKVVHNFNLYQNALFSGIPFIGRFAIMYLLTTVTNMLLRKKMLSKTGIRNLATFLSSCVCGILTVGVAFSGNNWRVAAAVMSANIILGGLFAHGPMAALIDMSPNFCAILTGISQAVGMTSGLISPIVVATLSKTFENDPIQQWQIIWAITGIIYAVTGIIFILFGNSELQSWNTEYHNNDEKILHDEN